MNHWLDFVNRLSNNQQSSFFHTVFCYWASLQSCLSVKDVKLFSVLQSSTTLVLDSSVNSSGGVTKISPNWSFPVEQRGRTRRASESGLRSTPALTSHEPYTSPFGPRASTPSLTFFPLLFLFNCLRNYHITSGRVYAINV